MDNTSAVPITQKIGIPFPPDDIFKGKRNRVRPAEEVWGNGSISYIPLKAEYIKGKGNFVYYAGILRRGDEVRIVAEEPENLRTLENQGWLYQPPVPFPSRCVAPVEAIESVDLIKRRFMSDIKFFTSEEMRYFLPTIVIIGERRRAKVIERYLTLFINEADLKAGRWYLEDDRYCNIAKAVRIFTRALLTGIGVTWPVGDKIGEIFGMMFEYDNAYRYRLADLLNEVNPSALIDNFPKEAQRLLVLEEERELLDNNDVTAKFRRAEKLFRFAWKIKKIRKAIQEAIRKIDWEDCKLTEEDIYHMALYGDYNTQGKSPEERVGILESYHGKDQTKWPPRIMIRNNGNNG